VGGRLFKTSDVRPTGRLGGLASCCHSSTQPFLERHYQSRTHPSTSRLSPTPGSLRTPIYERKSRRTNSTGVRGEGDGQSGDQQMGRTSPRLLVQVGRQSLARSKKFGASIRLSQTSPETAWPVQNHEADFASRLSIGPSPLMDDP
jgi:hypothetical protein